MGCTVTHGKRSSISLVQSPTNKRAEERLLSIKQRKSNELSTREEDRSVVGLPPISRQTEINESGSKKTLRQSSLKLPSKEPSSNEFSFINSVGSRNSIGSAQERSKDYSSPPNSSRKSLESATKRKLLNDNTIACRTGSSALKHAPPNRHSGRFEQVLEFSGSESLKDGHPIASLLQVATSAELIIREETKFEQEAFSSEISEEDSAKDPNFKRKESRTFTLNPKYSAKYFNTRDRNSLSKEQQHPGAGSEEILNNGQNQLFSNENSAIQATLNNINRFQKYRRLSTTSTELVSYIAKNNLPIKPSRPISLGSLSNIEMEQEKFTTGSTKICNTVESQTSIELNPVSTQESLVRDKKRVLSRKTSLGDSISSSQSEKSNGPASMNSLSQKETFAMSKESHDRHSSQANSKNFFKNHQRKLSVTDLFKLNLLDYVKDEEDDISPIVSSNKEPVALMPDKYIACQQKNSVLRSHKLDSIKELDSQSISSWTTNEKMDFSEMKSEQKQMLKRSACKDKQNESDQASGVNERSKQFIVRTGSGKLYRRNLFALVKENTQDDPKSQSQAPPVKIPLSKLERSGSGDLFGLRGMSPIQMNSPANFAADTGCNPVKQNNSRLIHNYDEVPQKSASDNCSKLNETHSRSIFNVEDNISATNISKYEFVYENIEVEYDEAKGVGRSPIIGPGERILTGIYSPMLLDARRLSHEQDSKRDTLVQGQANLAKLCGNQKKLLSHGTLSRKGSGASISSIHGIGQIDFIPESERTGEESPSFNQQFFDQFSMDNESSIQSKKQAAFFDSQKNRSLKGSLFHHDSESNLETGPGASLADDPRSETPKTLVLIGANYPFRSTKTMKNCAHSPVGIQETESNKEQSNITTVKGEDQRSQQNITQAARDDQKISTPTAQSDTKRGNTTKKPYYKLNSENQEGTRSPNLKGAILKRNQSVVIETSRLDKTRDDEGQKKINQYLMISYLGK